MGVVVRCGLAGPVCNSRNWSAAPRTHRHPLDAFRRNFPASLVNVSRRSPHVPARRPAHPRIADHRRSRLPRPPPPARRLRRVPGARPGRLHRSRAAAAAVEGDDHARAGASGFRTNEELTRYEDVTTYNNFYEFGTGKADPSQAPQDAAHQALDACSSAANARSPAVCRSDDLLKGLTARGARLPPALRGRLVDGDPVARRAAGARCSSASSRRRRRSTSPSSPSAIATQMPGIRLAHPRLAVSRRPAHRRGHASARLAGHRPLRQAAAAAERRAAAAGRAVEVRVQEHQVDRAIDLRRDDAGDRWHDAQPSEYGFFSNVNPNVDHPRWSQKTERRIAGTASKLFAERIPTQAVQWLRRPGRRRCTQAWT